MELEPFGRQMPNKQYFLFWPEVVFFAGKGAFKFISIHLTSFLC